MRSRVPDRPEKMPPGEKHSDTFEHISDKLLRPQELVSSTKNDALEPNWKANRRDYERELPRLHVTIASYAFS